MRDIARLRPAAWFMHGSSITVTGSGVSQWDDASGNARHLLQATDANRPAKQADGSILFDGVAHFLKCNAFALNQPETIYLLAKQVTWTSAERIFDGNTIDVMTFFQNDGAAPAPYVAMYAGNYLVPDAAGMNEWALNTYAVVCCIFNGASSVFRVNNGTVITGNVGAFNGGGFTLGARASGAELFSNIQVKEVILFSDAHDAATRATVNRYLMHLGGLT